MVGYAHLFRASKRLAIRQVTAIAEAELFELLAEFRGKQRIRYLTVVGYVRVPLAGRRLVT